jgi:ATP-dependent Lhr-like helicase
MGLQAFQPATRRWFTARFGAPTRAQAEGWPVIAAGRHTLIAAPTGSGKTLAAFLAALDSLLAQAAAGNLAAGVQVLYVSPLKALSRDIHKNLEEPLTGICEAWQAMAPDVTLCPIRAAVRTGDTPAGERAKLAKDPPHILVTTPESLYLLLTSESGRAMLGGVRTVIVDEVHAVVGSRRGSHLALSLERLAELTPSPPQRIGLSATQRPMTEVACFLVGGRHLDATGVPDCHIIDATAPRALDLSLELPDSPLEAIMSNEVWEEVYNRLVGLIEAHRTTLIFVNTRRLAERLTFHLSARLGEAHVTSHHGSLSAELRESAERRLKEGQLKVLVATASLELGIDIGAVDLVCQVGSVRTIAAFVQRIGRARHHLNGVPKGRLFPLTRDELVECTALLQCVRQGELDILAIPPQPLDILAQQIVAACAVETQAEDALYAWVRRAYPYRNLSLETFDAVVRMLVDGFSTRRGRRGALLHHDAVGGTLAARRAARLAALTCGGAIPDTGDYRVVLEPGGLVIGSLNEDFAVDSSAGDIFQLGNASWRIVGFGPGVVRVEDAHGQPPSMPFWFGEAPSRTNELSAAVSVLRRQVSAHLHDRDAALAGLCTDAALPRAAMEQLVDYLHASERALGAMPSDRCVVAERFFDEAGGMQLVLHTPFGSRINRAWGLALRKRFCKTFNFELQAAATEDALVLSLGEVHSFPLGDVFRFLHPSACREVLVQALLDAPMFQTRWRWNTSRALAILRSRGGRRVAPQILRMQAEDLVAAVFPDQLACFENLTGPREVPDHPLVLQTIEDCLTEAMDIDGLVNILERLHDGRLPFHAVDTPEPSPASHEILTARPYAFLDDAPAEERRTRAVLTRRTLESGAQAKGALDAAAIATVQADAWPRAETLEEVHDALLVAGFIAADVCAARTPAWLPALGRLASARRAACVTLTPRLRAHVAAERVTLLRAVYPDGAIELAPPPRHDHTWERPTALVELMRSQLQIRGPVTAAELATACDLPEADVDTALLSLESEGFVLRGHFRADVEAREWCERRLLARIHRLTIERLRREIEPVTATDLMRFFFAWQGVRARERGTGVDALAAVVRGLDGYELPARAWETHVLAARLRAYEPRWLDQLCLSGEAGWGRLSAPAKPTGTHAPRPLKSSPITLMWRDTAWAWIAEGRPEAYATPQSDAAQAVSGWLQAHGASFFGELVRGTGLPFESVESALAELACTGRVTSDSFAGLRALLAPARQREPRRAPGRRGVYTASVERAGRWSLGAPRPPTNDASDDARVMQQARTLLARWGVVFRRLLIREANVAPWRDLVRALRQLEARGEVRGGYFVAGVGGEQFALPEAVVALRAQRKHPPPGEVAVLCGADPLNLVGVLTPGERVAAVTSTRVVFRDGLPIAALEAGALRRLAPDAATDRQLEGWTRGRTPFPERAKSTRRSFPRARPMSA